jgi:hypothetical protein
MNIPLNFNPFEKPRTISLANLDTARPNFYFRSPFPDVKPASNISSTQYGGVEMISDEIRKLNLEERKKNLMDVRKDFDGYYVTSGGGNIYYPDYSKTNMQYKYRAGGYIQLQDAYSRNKCKPQDWW